MFSIYLVIICFLARKIRQQGVEERVTGKLG